jgi:hypothetical protein
MPLLQPPRSTNINALDLSRPLQLFDVFRRHLRVRIFHPVEHLVLLGEHEAQRRGTDTGDRHQANNDAESRSVVRRLRVPVCEWCPDAGHVANAVHKGQRSGTLRWWTRERVCRPCVDLRKKRQSLQCCRLWPKGFSDLPCCSS